MVRLLAERYDTKSNVKLGRFLSQLQASYVSSHTEELWYNETVCLWMTKYIYIYMDDNIYIHIYIYIYIYIYIVIHKQTVLLNHNSSVWLDTSDAWSWDRNPPKFTLDLVSYRSVNKRTTSARELLGIM